jgi:FAD-dependent oxidoreductase domain-containing protein 1
VSERADVVVVGGAVVGSAAAYFLATRMPPAAHIVLLECDPSYVNCATARSLASIRHQFSTPENIRLSMFGTAFLRDAPRLLAIGDEKPALGFVERGYLFLATEAGRAVLEANHRLQRAEGADVALLAPAELHRRLPWLHTDDLAAGALGLSGEGWLDGHALMHALRRKAAALGVQVRRARARTLRATNGRVVAVGLDDGTEIACGHVINAAGTGATELARTAGIELPVRARKRCVFRFRSPQTAPGCPLVIDPSGLYFRPEGDGFLCGIAPPEEADPDQDPQAHDFDVPLEAFEQDLWPRLARRVPGFDAARLVGAWAGHYDVNVLDHNAILGPHPDLPNLLFANGFSGHGLQQAPAVGRALAEWVVDGRSHSIELDALGWQRVIDRRPLRELNVV